MTKHYTRLLQEVLDAAKDLAIQKHNYQVDIPHVWTVLTQPQSFALDFYSSLDFDMNEFISLLNQEVAKIPVFSQTDPSRFGRQYSQRLRNLLEDAERERVEPRDEIVTVEHLILGLFRQQRNPITVFLQKAGIDRDLVCQRLNKVRQGKRAVAAGQESHYQALSKYASSFNQWLAEQPERKVIGRKEEIKDIIRVLSRKEKSNAILIGFPGVGKARVMEGFVRRLAEGDVPENLMGKEVFKLNLASLIAGSGGNGRITRRDVENYLPQAVPASQAAAVSAAEVQTAADYGAGLIGMRKTIAERMMNSLQASAQVTLHRKVDISRLIAFRQDMKDKVASPLENGEISITTLLTKAVAKALKDHPQLNAWYFNGQYQEVEDIHIGIATALSDGLVVPVIRHVDKLTLADLGLAIKTEANQARKGTLDPALYSGSTFSITNLDGAGIEYFTPILNTPEVAILGVGALQTSLALDSQGQVYEQKFLPLSLTFDHQVVDGQPAAEFLASLADKLESPYDLVF